MKKKYDVAVLTASKFVNPPHVDDYIKNVLHEDELVIKALKRLGLKAVRTAWDNPAFDWSETGLVLFRTVWDYFERYDEFSRWLEQAKKHTQFLNPLSTIYWNIDKHYLRDLQEAGVRTVETYYMERGDKRSLRQHLDHCSWKNAILKPAISGAGRHTYRINPQNIDVYEELFRSLIEKEAMMLQPFIENIISGGEVSHMLFDGRYSHSVLKKARDGDFRVQDDFGGTVHSYKATANEIAFAEKAIGACNPLPAYARVDVVWDNSNNLALAELELIEPELWFRMKPEAANALGNAVLKRITAELK